jgi:F-type H+-transporting ATPase subunit gamma
MGNSLGEVKKRISSTKSTAQITKAMYMVSSSKIKRAEKTYKGYRDFMMRIEDMVSNVVSLASEDVTNPLLTKREVKKTAYLIITSDKGLAGAYNANIYKALEEQVKNNHKSNDEFICAAIGKKGYSFISRRKYPLIKDSNISIRDDVMFMDIEPLAQEIINLYLSKQIDKLVIIHNHFVNSITYDVVIEELLPICNIKKQESAVDYEYEGGIERTLDILLPMYVKDIIYGVILDAKCAEHSARMNAMKNATDNANEVIDKLQLLYNRARQNVITNELIDIIGGANAIGGSK